MRSPSSFLSMPQKTMGVPGKIASPWLSRKSSAGAMMATATSIFLSAYFARRKSRRRRLMRAGAEPREVHRLAIDLDTVCGVGGERADEIGFESRQTRQFGSARRTAGRRAVSRTTLAQRQRARRPTTYMTTEDVAKSHPTLVHVSGRRGWPHRSAASVSNQRFPAALPQSPRMSKIYPTFERLATSLELASKQRNSCYADRPTGPCSVAALRGSKR